MWSPFLLILASSILSALSEERLPTDVVPTDYEIKLHMHPLTTADDDGVFYSSFTGTVCITFIYNRGAGRIKLHGKKKYGINYEIKSEMILTFIESEQKEEMKFIIDDVEYDDRNDMFVLPPIHLEPGLYKLCMPFRRVMNTKKGYYVVAAVGKRLGHPDICHPFTWTRTYRLFFIATNSPRQVSFPCFDEPYFEADFKLELNIEYEFDNKEVLTFTNDISNKQRIMYQDTGRNIVQDSYKISGVIPSKVSFAVTNMACFNGKSIVNTEVNYKYRACYVEEKLFSMKKTALHLMHIPRRRFNTKLMKNTFLLIAPGYGKTASYIPGLNLISQSELFGPDDDLQLFLRLNSQLFGGLIKPASWDDEWILSGLVVFCSYRQLKTHHYKKGDLSLLMTEQPQKVPDFLLKEFTGGLQQDKPDTNKGVMLLNMVYSILEDDRFDGFLKSFIDSKQFTSITPSDLWAVLDVNYRSELPAGMSWANIMDGWEKQQEHPLVSVDLSQSYQITVTQEIFYGNYGKKMKHEESKRKGSSKEICWIIPLSYTIIKDVKKHHVRRNKDPEQKVELIWHWLPCDTSKQTVKTRASADDLVLVNTDYKSFLRVKYDSDTQIQIINELRDRIELFSPNQRAQLINDAFSIAWSGYQDYDFAFKLMNVAFSVKKPEMKVWNALFSSIHNLNEMLLSFPETYEKFKMYLKNTMKNVYNANYDSKHNPFEQLISVDLKKEFPEDGDDDMFIEWACTVAQIGGCVDAAIGVFNKWHEDHENRKVDAFSTYFSYVGRSSSLVYTVICTAVSTAKKGNDELEDRYFFLEDSIKGAAFFSYRDWREEYVEALRCVRDPGVLESTYEWIAEEEVQFQPKYERHKGKVFLLLAENPITHPLTVQFFYDKFEVLAYRHRSKIEYLANFVRTLTSKMDNDQITEMNNFILSRTELNNLVVLDAFKEGWTAAKNRQKWLNSIYPNIQKLLSATT